MEFRASTRIKNIFYGDIFNVSNKGFLVFGFGKSKAFKNLVLSDSDIVALDMACLTDDGENLYGHMEMEAVLGDIDPIINKIKIDFMVRMLDQEETEKVYHNSEREIREISVDEFIKISQFNIRFTQQEVGAEVFDALVSGKVVKCIIVPWFDDFNMKIKMLDSYISKQ